MTTRSQLTRRIVRAMPVEELRERCEEVRAYLDAKIRALEDDALECTCHDDDDSDEFPPTPVLAADRSVEPVWIDCGSWGMWATDGHHAVRQGEHAEPHPIEGNRVPWYRSVGVEKVLDATPISPEEVVWGEYLQHLGKVCRFGRCGLRTVIVDELMARPWESCVWRALGDGDLPPYGVFRDGLMVAVVMPRRPL